MTVQNLYVKSPYVGNGTKRKFPITFEWLKGYTEHIQVFVRNKNGVLAQTTNYTLEQDPSTNTYSVVYPTSGDALATGEKLIIVRELPLTQILNLVNQGPYFAEDIELTFDEVVMMIQQLNEKLGRSLKVGVDIDTDNDIDITVPVPTDNKNYGIRMTKNGFELVRDPQDAYDAAVAHNEASIKEMNDIRDENVATTTELKDEAEAAKTAAQNAAKVATDSIAGYEQARVVLDNIDNYRQQAQTAATTSVAKSQEATTSATLAGQKADLATTKSQEAAASAASAQTTASALTEFLNTKEILTAPAIDTTLSISGGAADSKTVGDKLVAGINKCVYESVVDLSVLTIINGFVYSNGKWYSSANGNYNSWVIPLAGETTIIVKANTTSIYVSFLKGTEFPVPKDGAVPNYATGENNRHTIEADSERSLNIPTDATYIVIGRKFSSTDYMPSNVKINKASEKIVDIENQISAIDNKFDSTKIIDIGELQKGYIRNDNGLFTHVSGGYEATDYIPIRGKFLNVNVTFPKSDMSGCAFYDANKNFIIGYKQETMGEPNETVKLDIPANACYFRTCRYLNSAVYQPINIEIYSLVELFSDYSNKIAELKSGDSENPLENIIKDGGLFRVFPKVGVIGDSLSVGGFNSIGSSNIDTDMDRTWFSWGQQLQRMCGNEIIHFGHSGWSTRDWLRGWGSNNTFLEQWCYSYIIALGVNDKLSSGGHDLVPIGNEADVSLTDRSACADTFYGNLANIVLRCKEATPNAKIFILTNPRADGETLGYNAVVRYIASVFDNVYLVDLYTYGSNIYAQMMNDNNYWYGSHMTAIGYLVSAYHISTYIDWIIRHNSRAFRDVQFITKA